MPFSRSHPAFFHRKDVRKLIERIASQESLVIYAGAGVTIDRTGLSWKDLVERLLKEHIGDPIQRKAVLDANTALQASTVVSHYYFNRYGKDWKKKVHHDLRALLYSGRVWQKGELSNAIVRLGAALARKGKEFSVVTTNYDTYIEKAIEELRLFDAESIRELDLAKSVVDHSRAPSGDVAQHTQPNRIVYLHGYVPDSDRGDDQDVILGEPDYSRSHALSRAVLTELFTKNSVLILGSSLVDAPLLDALAATKIDRRGSSKSRLAIVALQGITFPVDSPAAVERVKASIEMRMEQFGAECVFPDFHYQVPQLLTEAQVCLDRCQPGQAYADDHTQVRYGLRLTSWWGHWWGGRRRNVEVNQSLDHKALRAGLSEILTILDTSNERMKLEMWVRWDVEDQSKRQLQLWASSTGTWPDIDCMRVADIRADSENFSVKAFCLGRPEIYEMKAQQNDRWLTYLCVPIKVTVAGGELPVGVISLASMNRTDESKINEQYGTLLYEVIPKMSEIGIQIATPS